VASILDMLPTHNEPCLPHTPLPCLDRVYSYMLHEARCLTASVDSRFSHKIWQEEELSKMVQGGVPFPMLTDSGGRVGSVYGVYDEEAGVDIRGRFIIDPDGVIQAVETVAPPVGRNVAELIRQVKAFQHVRATGEVCPSGWQPGKPTLKPSPDLAGKVWKVWKPDMAF
jgi:alkyl hydroperoxide reductase subunit AhpC